MHAFESDPGHPPPGEQGNVYDARMEGMQAGSTNARIDALSEKIDALSQSIDKRIEQVDKRIEQIDKRIEQADDKLDAFRKEMKAGFNRADDKLDAVRRETKEGFDRVDGRFDWLYYVLIGAMAVIIAAMITAPHL